MSTERITAIRARLTDRRRQHCIEFLDRTRHDKHTSVCIMRQHCKTYLATIRPPAPGTQRTIEHSTEVENWGRWMEAEC